MNKIYTIIIFLILSGNLMVAQPSNDNCSGATVVTPNGTCYGGTTTGANDSWTGTVGCQSGNNHADVWYTFTGTGTQLALDITNGTQGGNIEFTLVSALAACSGLVLEGSACGASPLTTTLTGLTAGTTYYYTISSTGANGTFTTCVNNTTPPPVSGQDCPTAAILCNTNSFSQGSSTAGAGAISGNASNENLSALGCLAADERQSQWYKFTVSSTGTAQFIVDPNTNTNDYDWAIYNITTSACALTPGGSAAGGASQVACNFSGCPGNTGIAASGLHCSLLNYDCVGNPGDCSSSQLTSTLPTLTAGNTYALVIDNFSLSNDGFSFSWLSGTTAGIGTNATFTANVSASPCMNVTVSRTPYYTGANMTYTWNFGDGFTSTSGLPATHTYTSTGFYNVSLTVTDALGCSDFFSQTVNVGCLLPIELLSFDGYNSGETNVLNWATATETNNDYFVIERSSDAVVFREIGAIDGAGTSNSKRTYSYIDKSPLKGISYYRLRQVDFDKKSELSDVIAIDRDATIGMDYYPSPAKDILNVSAFGVKNRTSVFKIYNMLGELVSLLEVKNNETNVIEIVDLKSGIYIIELDNGVKTLRDKFVKE